MALLTFVGLVAPVYFIPPAVASVLPLGRPAVVVASLALIVPLMSYAILPALLWLERTATSGARWRDSPREGSQRPHSNG